MKHSPRWCALLIAWLCGGGVIPAAAQDDREGKGKIREVEEDADSESDPEGFLRILWETGRFVVRIVPWLAGSGGRMQGYLDYPYSDPRALEHFVLREVPTHQRFGSLTAAYFADARSTLRGAHVAWEAARGPIGLSFEYDYLREPMGRSTDYLHLARVGASGLSRISHAAFVRSGLAARAMVLDDGRAAFGPEIEVGAQVFPLRPLAFDGTFRVAGLTGAGASWFGTGLLDGSAGAGVLIGRVEVRAGYRFLTIGHSTTLAGPTFGARIWF